MSMRWCCSGLLAGLLVACGAAQQNPSAASATTGTLIEVSHTEARIDGKLTTDPKEAVAGLLRTSPPPDLILRATPDAPQQVLLDVIRQASGVSIQLRLELGALRALSQPFQFADCQIVAMFSAVGARAWEVERLSAGELTAIGPWQFDDVEAEARARDELTRASRGRPCHATLSLDSDVSPLRALRSWQRVAREQAASSSIHASASAPPVVKSASVMSGRLPPEVIQSIVRVHFYDFRVCYEKGLAKNDRLRGKISIRFVIGREGMVTEATDAGSDIPDPQVRSCIVDAFKQYRFPSPEGGIVTVIYPIMLAPG